MEKIPTLSLADADASGQRFDRLIAAMGNAYETWGFCAFVDHGIDLDLLAAMRIQIAALFALPTSIKMRYRIPEANGQRGYTPFAVETARGSQYPDLKEFWHIGRASDDDHEGPEQRNVWPMEVPGFQPVAKRLFAAMDQESDRLLRLLARHLGEPDDRFVPPIGSNATMRLLHYPPLTPPAPSGPCVRAAPHEDISLITLLAGASAEGLEVLSRQGEWVQVPLDDNAIIVNIGDMLQRWTGGVYRSTTHRVVNPTGPAAALPRFSMPFFKDAANTTLLDCLSSCLRGRPRDALPPPITARDYLMERLREIKVAT